MKTKKFEQLRDVKRENAGAATKKMDEPAGERGVDVKNDSVRNRSSIKW